MLEFFPKISEDESVVKELNERSRVRKRVILATQFGRSSIELYDKTRFCNDAIPHTLVPIILVLILLKPHREHSRVIVDERLLKSVGKKSKFALSENRKVKTLVEKKRVGSKFDWILLLLTSMTEINVAFERVQGRVDKKLLLKPNVKRP